MSTFKELVDKLISKHGTLQAVARAANMDPGYLSRLRYGEKFNPSKEVLDALGIEVSVNYKMKKVKP